MFLSTCNCNCAHRRKGVLRRDTWSPALSYHTVEIIVFTKLGFLQECNSGRRKKLKSSGRQRRNCFLERNFTQLWQLVPCTRAETMTDQLWTRPTLARTVYIYIYTHRVHTLTHTHTGACLNLNLMSRPWRCIWRSPNIFVFWITLFCFCHLPVNNEWPCLVC